MITRSKCRLSCFAGPLMLVIGIWSLVAVLIVLQESREPADQSVVREEGTLSSQENALPREADSESSARLPSVPSPVSPTQ